VIAVTGSGVDPLDSRQTEEVHGIPAGNSRADGRSSKKSTGL
jgi:hypothetical protein